MKKLSIIMSILITAFVALGTAQADWHGKSSGEGHHGRMQGGHGFLWIVDQLQLSDGQTQEIASILEKHRAEIGTTLEGMAQARGALRETMTADDYSEAAVRDAAHKVAEQEEQATVLRAQIMNEIKPVLTPDQKERLAQFANRRGDKIKGFVEARLAELDKWIADHKN